MSKAFTKEDSAEEAPLVRRPVRLEPGEKRYMTQEGHARLVRARDSLVAARTSANAVETDAKLATLNELLDSVTVVPLTRSPDTVYFGAYVEVEDEDGLRMTWRLVGPDEADAAAGWISVNSPLGRAMVGKRVGETATVERPRGAREYEVVAVRYDGPDPS